jgi:HPt (histidine-containing phosphotransfer) domain-containing protein
MESQGNQGVGNNSKEVSSLLEEGWMQAFRAIDRSRGKNLLARITNLFSYRIPCLVEALRETLRDSNSQSAEIAAHSLASNFSSVGALSLARGCSRLEVLARTGQFETIGRLLPGIESGYRQVMVALGKQLERSKGDREADEGT